MTSLTQGMIVVVQYRGRDTFSAGEPQDNRYVRVERVEQMLGDHLHVTSYLDSLDPRLGTFTRIEPLFRDAVMDGKQKRIYRDDYVAHYIHKEVDPEQVWDLIRQQSRIHPAVFGTEAAARALVLPRRPR